MEEYLERYRKLLLTEGFTVHSAKNYTQRLKKLSIYVNKNFSQITTKDIKDFLYHLISDLKLSSATLRVYYFSLKKFFVNIVGKTTLFDTIPIVPQTKKLPQPFTYLEIKELAKAVPTLQNKLIILLIYSSGIMLKECLNLRVEDIDMVKRRIFVRKTVKSGSRYTLLSRRIWELMKLYLNEYKPVTWLFPGDDANTPLTKSGCSSFFQRAKEKVGMTKKGGFKNLRQSFAGHLLDTGINIVTLQHLLGHKNIKSTLHYLPLNYNDTLRICSPLDIYGDARLFHG